MNLKKKLDKHPSILQKNPYTTQELRQNRKTIFPNTKLLARNWSNKTVAAKACK